MTEKTNSKKKYDIEPTTPSERKINWGAKYRFRSLEFRILNSFGIWCLCFDFLLLNAQMSVTRHSTTGEHA